MAMEGEKVWNWKETDATTWRYHPTFSWKPKKYHEKCHNKQLYAQESNLELPKYKSRPSCSVATDEKSFCQITCVPVGCGNSLVVLARSGGDLQYQNQEVEEDSVPEQLQHPYERIVWGPAWSA